MLDDDRTSQDGPDRPLPDRPATARPGPRGGPMTVLAFLLMAGTSWVVGVLVSPWLVVPYLLVMALILLPSPGRRPDAGTTEADPGSTPATRPEAPGEDDAEPAGPDPSPASAGSTEGELDQASASPGSPKPRRGKGKTRKTRTMPEVASATWIMVGPGKFVRVEAPTSPTDAEPHDPSLRVPAEVTPSPPEPAEDAFGTAVDHPVAGPEVAPAPGVELEAPPLAEVDPSTGPDRTHLATPTADGIKPHVRDDQGWPGPDRTETDPGPLDDDRTRIARDRDGSMIEEASDLADHLAPRRPTGPTALDDEADGRESPRPSEVRKVRAMLPDSFGIPNGRDHAEAASIIGPEPTSDHRDRPAVPPEETDADAWIRADDGLDPTETPVDETDLDDAEPGPAHLPAIGPGAFIFDDPAAAADPAEAVPTGFPWRIQRLSPIRRHPRARALGRESPSRRPPRSPGPIAPRRPLDPRRLTRRGGQRPRQITRTLPPRSPPSERLSGGEGNFRSEISDCKCVRLQVSS